MKNEKAQRIGLRFDTPKERTKVERIAKKDGKSMNQVLNDMIKAYQVAILAACLLLFTSCASTYNLAEVRGHYTPQDTTAPCPSSVDIFAETSTAHITVTDKDNKETTINYFVAPDGQLIRANLNQPATYLMSVGYRTLMLTTIDGQRFKYNLTK